MSHDDKVLTVEQIEEAYAAMTRAVPEVEPEGENLRVDGRNTMARALRLGEFRCSMCGVWQYIYEVGAIRLVQGRARYICKGCGA